MREIGLMREAGKIVAEALGLCRAMIRPGVRTLDINQAVVTKLADRGSHQALGIVTDAALFLAMLADELCG